MSEGKELEVLSLALDLMLGKIEGRRRRGQHRMRWLDGIINLMVDGITDSMDMNLSKLWERLKGKEASCAAVHGVISDFYVSTYHDTGFQYFICTSFLRLPNFVFCCYFSCSCLFSDMFATIL